MADSADPLIRAALQMVAHVRQRTMPKGNYVEQIPSDAVKYTLTKAGRFELTIHGRTVVIVDLTELAVPRPTRNN